MIRAMRAPRNSAVNKVMGPLEWLLLVALAVLWGGSFFFIKLSLTGFRPLTIVLGRVAIAALALNLAIVLSGQRMPTDARRWGSFFVMGLVNNAIPISLLVWAQSHIASGLASILNAATPFFTVLVAHWFTRDERLSWSRVAGVLLGFFGVAAMIGIDALHHVGSDLLAETAALAATLSYALAGVYGRRFAALPPLVSASGQLTASTIMMAPLALAVDRPWQAAPGPVAWGALAALGLLSTGLAYVLYFRILRTAGAVNLLLVTLLVPVTAILLGTLVLHERLGSGAFLGMALIALGLGIIDGRPWRRLCARINPRTGRAPGSCPPAPGSSKAAPPAPR
jgi:drug/metabolite transporter (DMT)-like permease